MYRFTTLPIHMDIGNSKNYLGIKKSSITNMFGNSLSCPSWFINALLAKWIVCNQPLQNIWTAYTRGRFLLPDMHAVQN